MFALDIFKFVVSFALDNIVNLAEEIQIEELEDYIDLEAQYLTSDTDIVSEISRELVYNADINYGYIWTRNKLVISNIIALAVVLVSSLIMSFT